MGPGEAVAIGLLAALAAFVSAVSGFGFALLITPALSFIVGAKDAVVLANILASTNAIAMFILLRTRIVWRLALPLAAAAFAGMPFGVVILTLASGQVMSIIIAVTVLAATVAIWRGGALPLGGLVGTSAAGFTSGVLYTSTSFSGPPVVLYLAGMRLEPLPFRATLAAFFMGGSFFGLSLYVIAGQIDAGTLARAGVGFPGLVAGWFAGSMVFARLSGARFRRVVIGVLVVSAVLVLVRALTG